MKKLLLVLLAICIHEVYGQSEPHVYFRLDTVINNLKLMNVSKGDMSATLDTTFHGISGIDYKSGIWHLISDKYGNSFKITDENINNLSSENTKKIQNDFLKGGESIRLFNDKLFYCAEKTDTLSVLGILQGGVQKEIATFKMSQKNYNRGFEGLTLSDDGKSLFVSIESSTEVQDESPFVDIILFKEMNGTFSNTNKINYRYPLDKNSCTTRFNGKYGNGISEILFLEENNLLVLERCFDGSSIKAKLYQAILNTTNSTITKVEVMNFNTQGSGLVPDNIEGMTFGPPKEGIRTLYLIADDNFKPTQKTQLIRLLEVK